jgi:predicted glycosyltransferase
MKILFYLHHPAHFHLFKNVIRNLSENHDLTILATKKDILENLLSNFGLQYTNVLPKGRKDNKFSMALGLLKQDYRLLKINLRIRPDLLVGTSIEITHIGKLLNIPSVFVNEDDINVIPLVGKLAYPFAKTILVPIVCDVGKYRYKTSFYQGYHELAYLHPNHFIPDKSIISKYISSEQPFYILRFAKLKAHHDQGIKGIDADIARNLIKLLSPKGNIYITAERELEPEFEKYRMNINPLDIHHVMAFAALYIGDSQTMAAEAGVLGTPFIRYNDFVGRISYLAELENRYHLGFGIKPDNPEKLFSTVEDLLSTKNLKTVFQERRNIMLSEKIDTARFLTWFIEEYPISVDAMRNNSDVQHLYN